MERRWVPLLDGNHAEQARESVAAIARDVEHVEAPPAMGPRKAIDLANGKAGVAVFLDYVARATDDPRYGAAASRAFEAAVAGAATVELSPELFGGFTGIAWVQNHLTDVDPDTTEIDEVLLQILERDSWDGLTDLI